MNVKLSVETELFVEAPSVEDAIRKAEAGVKHALSAILGANPEFQLTDYVRFNWACEEEGTAEEVEENG